MVVEREAFVDRKVAVEERRTLDVRPDDVAHRSGRRRTEAGRVEILARFQPASRVARDLRLERNCVGAELVLRRKARACRGPIGIQMVHAAPAYVQVAAGISLDWGAA